jgi:hypothetical protein
MSVSYHFDPSEFLEEFDRYFEKAQKIIQSQENSEQIISKLETSGNTEIGTITKTY